MGRQSTLRQVKVKSIDLDQARAHFELPIDEQFSSKADLVSALQTTKEQLLQLFAGEEVISIWRGVMGAIDIPTGDLTTDDLGICWSFAMDGALKGSGLDRTGQDGVILWGTVAESNIDWEMTIAVNSFHEEEREIVVKAGAPVTLLQAWKWPSKTVILDRRADQDHDTTFTM